MTVIYLVRHGQASFAEQDYDKLSMKGEEQAKILGRYWRELESLQESPKQGIQFYSGSLLRHEQTAENFLSKYLKDNTQANSANNSLITHSGFNELDHVDILGCFNENWRSFQSMCSSQMTLDNQNNNNRKDNNAVGTFQKAFIEAINRWISGENDNDYKESWPQFKSRCIASLHEVLAQNTAHQKSTAINAQTSQKRALIIFTSGGVIGVIIGHILGLSDQKSLQISQQLINSSVTKIIATTDGLKLNYLNNYSHLELSGKDWLSYY